MLERTLCSCRQDYILRPAAVSLRFRQVLFQITSFFHTDAAAPADESGAAIPADSPGRRGRTAAADAEGGSAGTADGSVRKAAGIFS